MNNPVLIILYSSTLFQEPLLRFPTGWYLRANFGNLPKGIVNRNEQISEPVEANNIK
jgi:hypothetical protein